MRPLIKASRPLAIAAVALLLVLSGCKSKDLPTFPTPPSIPAPSPPMPSAPPPSGMPPPPSSSPSQPSSPSEPSKPKTPSSPSDSAKGPKGKKSDQSGEKPSGEQAGDPSNGEAGTPGDQKAAQAAAGDDLQKAGERLAKAGSGEIDPLIPETDSDSTDDGDVFSDDSAAAGSPADASTGENAAAGAELGESGEAGDSSNADGESGSGSPASGSEQIEGLPGDGIPGDLSDEILAAQEALAKAGDALQEAGSAVANAETDEELAAAEELLSDARISVIIASQDIEILEGEMAGTPGWGNAGDDPFKETSAALQEANIALVIATRAVLIAKTGSAELPGGDPNGVPGNGGTQSGTGQVAVLEGELDESLIIFEGQIGDARDSVLSTAPPPETNPTGIQRPDGEVGEGMILLPPDSEPTDKPTEQQVATATMPDLNQGDIPDPQGDDIVAQQIREAAMSETDPELQAKLWEEYKRYREGL